MSPLTTHPSYRSVFSYRAFALLLVGQATSTFGDTLYDVALLFYVFGTTHSALAASGIAIAATAGHLVASFPAAALVDRLPLRRVMLLADSARLILTLAAGLAWIRGDIPSLPVLYGLAFLVAIGGAFFGPARAAAVPEILPSDHLVVANALDGLLGSLTFTVTWGLSGFIVAAIGAANGLLLDAATFFVSLSFVAVARWEGRARQDIHNPSGQASRHPLADVCDGLNWVRGEPLVRAMLVAQGGYTLAAAVFFTGLVPFLTRHLHGGAALYGVQGAVFGGGLAIASWLIGLFSVRKIGLLYCVGLVVNGVGNSLFALAPSMWYLLPAVFIAGVGKAAHATGERTLLQVRTPESIRGRVFVLWGTLAQLVVAPMLAIGGWVSDHIPAQETLLAASIVHVGIGLWLRARADVTQAQSSG